eukprot:970106-Amphidinium_carterae.2
MMNPGRILVLGPANSTLRTTCFSAAGSSAGRSSRKGTTHATAPASSVRHVSGHRSTSPKRAKHRIVELTAVQMAKTSSYLDQSKSGTVCDDLARTLSPSSRSVPLVVALRGKFSPLLLAGNDRTTFWA